RIFFLFVLILCDYRTVCGIQISSQWYDAGGVLTLSNGRCHVDAVVGPFPKRVGGMKMHPTKLAEVHLWSFGYMFSCFSASMMFFFFTLELAYSMVMPTIEKTAMMAASMLIQGMLNG